MSAQAKVRQMIRDEEQKAQELEQEIALMQREGHFGLQHGPPLQQRAQVEDLQDTSACNTGHPCNSAHKSKTCTSPSTTTPSHTSRHSKVSTTSTSEVPWRHTCK